MSLIDELKGVLARRKNVLEVFGTYQSMYDELLQGLAHNYNSDVDTATSAFYLANYVMDNIQGDDGRLDDDERVQHVLKNLIKAKEHLTVDFETLVNIYSLIFDWAIKIEKEMVKNARLLIDPKVITTNIVDIYAIPLFSFLQRLIPKLDLRWAMAELDASLRKKFSGPIYDELIKHFTIESMQPKFYFDAGFYIIRQFVDDYFKEKFEEGYEKLETLGDVGRKPFNHSCSIFYDIISRDLYTKVAKDDQIILDDELLNELNNSLLINKITSKPENPYKLMFAKYHIKIKVQGQRTEERFLYIENFEESEADFQYDELLGMWNYYLLSEEDVNLQSIISYSKQRCIDVRGITTRLMESGKISSDDIDLLLTSWMEMLINNLQEEYNFLEIKDSLREQNFIPICLLKQSKDHSEMNMLIDTVKPISSKRMEMLGIQSSMITSEQVIHLLDHVKLITDHTSNITRLLLLQHNRKIEIEFYPLELLYDHRQYEGKNILLLFSKDESNLIGLICPNEASLEFSASSLKSRQIFSKLNQLLSDLKFKNLEDSRAAKLSSFITRGVEKFSDPGQLWLSGNIKEPLGISTDSKSVTDRIDLAMKLEEERLEKIRDEEAKRHEAMETERQQRLKAFQILYFNEKVLKRLFEEITLKTQSKLLDLLLKSFPEISNLDKIERSIKMKLTDFEKAKDPKEMLSSEIKDIFNQVTSNIITSWFNESPPDLTMLNSIWELVLQLKEGELM